MTKPVTPELINNIVQQKRQNELDILNKLCSDDTWVFRGVAENPGQSPVECMEKLGEDPSDYDMSEVNAALAEHNRLEAEKEEERRQQELAKMPKRTNVVYAEEEEKEKDRTFSICGVKMSDDNHFVELEIDSGWEVNMFNLTSKEQVERVIANLQEAAKVFS